MGGLKKQKTNYVYDAASNKSGLDKTSSTTDIHHIRNWIQQIEENNPNQALSDKQKEKIKFLLLSLKNISNHTPQMKDVIQKIYSQQNSGYNPNKKSQDDQSTTNTLRKRLSYPNFQGQQTPEKANSLSNIPRQKIVADSSKELTNTHNLSGLKSYHSIIEKNDTSDILHHDIANLSKSMSELCRIISISGMRSSSDHIEQILSKMDTLAKECSLRDIDNNWQVTTKCFKELDFKSIHEKINSLACQISTINRNIDKKTRVTKENKFDEKLLSILNNTNNLLSLVQPLNESISKKQISSIDVTLSEIKKAIENKNQSKNSNTQDTIQRFEERLHSIDQQVKNIHCDVLYQKKPTEKSVQSLEILNQRIQKLEKSLPAIKIEESLNSLSKKVISIAKQSDNQILAEKLDTILQYIDNVTKPNQFNLQESFQKLESKIQNIVLQLEKTQHIPSKENLFHNLSRQISSIHALVNKSFESKTLSQRTEEENISLKNYIVDTAKKTSDSMLNLIDKRQDIERILKQGMNECFERAQKVHVEQTIKNFTTLYEMLVKISQKLEKPFEESGNKPSVRIEDTTKNFAPRKSLISSTIEKSGFNTQSTASKKVNQKQGSNKFTSQLQKNNDPHSGASLSTESNLLNATFKKSNEDPANKNMQGIDETIPNNIQQILNRVSSIQDGIWDEYDTIDYISAARRAASTSLMDNDLIVNNNNSENKTKKRWFFFKDTKSNNWIMSMMIATMLLLSSFLLFPSIGETAFMTTTENFDLATFIEKFRAK